MEDYLAQTYDYIPLPLDEFMPSFEAAQKVLTKPVKFLDAGCGYGEKLKLARDIGWEASGLEIRPEDIEPGLNVIMIDAFDFDKYADYDCVFVFHLFIDSQKEIELEKKVMDAMKSGAVLILHGALNPGRDFNWETLSLNCWRKP